LLTRGDYDHLGGRGRRESSDHGSGYDELLPRYARSVKVTNLTDADVGYIRANFRPLADVCQERGERLEAVEELIRERRLPASSYVLPDGTKMVPPDYFDFIDEAGGPESLRAEFERRHRGAGGSDDELEADWQGYVDGIYGICLRSVSPETIVRKSRLVESIGALLEHEAPDEAEWRAQLRRQVDELDALEREFSPDYDRRRFDRTPSRDRLIVAAHERFPALFAAEVASRGR
jgi:hypothetical protein